MIFDNLRISRTHSSDTLASSISGDSQGEGYTPNERVRVENILAYAQGNVRYVDRLLQRYTVTEYNRDYHFSVAARRLLDSAHALRGAQSLMQNKRVTAFDNRMQQCKQQLALALMLLNYRNLKLDAKAVLAFGDKCLKLKRYDDAFDAYVAAGCNARIAGDFAGRLVRESTGVQVERTQHTEWAKLLKRVSGAVSKLARKLDDPQRVIGAYNQGLNTLTVTPLSLENLDTLINRQAEYEYLYYGVLR